MENEIGSSGQGKKDETAAPVSKSALLSAAYALIWKPYFGEEDYRRAMVLMELSDRVS